MLSSINRKLETAYMPNKRGVFKYIMVYPYMCTIEYCEDIKNHVVRKWME